MAEPPKIIEIKIRRVIWLVVRSMGAQDNMPITPGMGSPNVRARLVPRCGSSTGRAAKRSPSVPGEPMEEILAYCRTQTSSLRSSSAIERCRSW